MSGGAPAFDGSGYVFLSTGNGLDSLQGNGEYGDSVIRLKNDGTNALYDYYSPPDYDELINGGTVACTQPGVSQSACSNMGCTLNGTYCQIKIKSDDWDVSSGGVVLLNPTYSLQNPEVLAGGKQGMLYVVYAHSMGNIDSQANNPDKYPCTQGASPANGTIAQCFYGSLPASNIASNGIHSTPAFLAGQSTTNSCNGHTDCDYLYVVGSTDSLRGWYMGSSGTFASTSNVPSGSAHTFSYPGATPSLTWSPNATNGINDAIVWVVDTDSYGKVCNNNPPEL
jgi:hypothetical protein